MMVKIEITSKDENQMIATSFRNGPNGTILNLPESSEIISNQHLVPIDISIFKEIEIKSFNGGMLPSLKNSPTIKSYQEEPNLSRKDAVVISQKRKHLQECDILKPDKDQGEEKEIHTDSEEILMGTTKKNEIEIFRFETENLRLIYKNQMFQELVKRGNRLCGFKATNRSIRNLVTEIEKALFLACNNNIEGKYRSWLKGFVEQIISIGNDAFFADVIDGIIDAPRLISIEPEKFSELSNSIKGNRIADNHSIFGSSNLKQKNYFNVVDQLLDFERETSLEHGSHVFDDRCLICKDKNKDQQQLFQDIQKSGKPENYIEDVAKNNNHQRYTSLSVKFESESMPQEYQKDFCNFEYNNRTIKLSLLNLNSPKTINQFQIKSLESLQVLDRIHKFEAYQNLFDLTKKHGRNIFSVYIVEPTMEIEIAPFKLLLLELFELNSVLRIKPHKVYASASANCSYFIYLAKNEPPPDYVFPTSAIESARESDMTFLVVVNEELNKPRFESFSKKATLESEFEIQKIAQFIREDLKKHETCVVDGPYISKSFFDNLKDKMFDHAKNIPIKNVHDVEMALKRDWNTNELLLIARRFIALGTSRKEVDIVHKLCLNYVELKKKMTHKREIGVKTCENQDFNSKILVKSTEVLSKTITNPCYDLTNSSNLREENNGWNQ